MAIFIALGAILWMEALRNLYWRKDLSSSERYAWLAVICVFSLLGAVAYLLFGPRKRKDEREAEMEAQQKPVPSFSWNPILGANSFGEGQGLNSADASKWNAAEENPGE